MWSSSVQLLGVKGLIVVELKPIKRTFPGKPIAYTVVNRLIRAALFCLKLNCISSALPLFYCLFRLLILKNTEGWLVRSSACFEPRGFPYEYKGQIRNSRVTQPAETLTPLLALFMFSLCFTALKTYFYSPNSLSELLILAVFRGEPLSQWYKTVENTGPRNLFKKGTQCLSQVILKSDPYLISRKK